MAGQALLIVEGAERPLRAGDYVHWRRPLDASELGQPQADQAEAAPRLRAGLGGRVRPMAGIGGIPGSGGYRGVRLRIASRGVLRVLRRRDPVAGRIGERPDDALAAQHAVAGPFVLVAGRRLKPESQVVG